MDSPKPKSGDSYVVESPFAAIVLTHWQAPFTSGQERILPRGLEFIVDFDPPQHATGIGAKPTTPDAWEALLVDDADRSAEKYGGYSLTIPFADLETYCLPLP